MREAKRERCPGCESKNTRPVGAGGYEHQCDACGMRWYGRRHAESARVEEQAVTSAPLPAGPELDAAVARVLGWTQDEGFWVQPKGWRASFPLREHAPRFSTYVLAAWEIVEYLRRRGWDVEVHAASNAQPQPYWCRLEPPAGLNHFEGGGDSMPEAVCRVVLLAADVLQEVA